jgi:hypothetical protein
LSGEGAYQRLHLPAMSPHVLLEAWDFEPTIIKDLRRWWGMYRGASAEVYDEISQSSPDHYLLTCPELSAGEWVAALRRGSAALLHRLKRSSSQQAATTTQRS